MTKGVLFVLLCVAAGVSQAQTACPYGAVPGSALCLPDEMVDEQPVQQNQVRWRSNWGAIAYDPDEGVAGTSPGRPTKSAARREALGKCRQMGGRNCAITIMYANQCAVIAEPPPSEQARYTSHRYAATADQAANLALTQCEEGNPGKRCSVIYSNCALSVRVR
ncbi:DUF4189 domain-containing protein [Xanthomonas sp. XNM01]|uniref:DUF4189 domain-containing protein n=1 Tax=Xanthomonas sp. XNM01 TaxID=2769289 RepID=UPI0017863A5B|nr:DUF4189 domain-containing protein [Xanthomonas sp. XNM01]MBD9367752.1 DUF4189 domain-containing protein [Xanthomonas sp. XNM01]